MAERDNDNPNPLEDQLDLEYEDERALAPFEEAERQREDAEAHYAAREEWRDEEDHDYENPDSGFAYDFVQHTEPKPVVLPSAAGPGVAPVVSKGYKAKLASEVKEEMVPWLWEDRVPLGALTILDGDPGVGKTTIVLDLMARLSQGDAMPFAKSGAPLLPPANALVVSIEDSIAFTLVPRLRLAGADLDRVWLLTDYPLFPSGLEKLKETIKDTRARLVMVDPGLAMFDEKINPNSDAETRRVVGGLAGLAADCEAAIVFIRHLNKTPGNYAMYRGGGSIAISATARSGLLAAFPRKRGTKYPVLASFKNSLGLKPPTLSYEIVGDVASGVSRIQWREEVAMTADESLEWEGMPGVGAPAPSRAQRLDERLLETIRDLGRATPSEASRAVKRRRADVLEALDRLVEQGVLAFEEEKRGKQGRPTRVYRMGDPLNSVAQGPQEDFDTEPEEG